MTARTFKKIAAACLLMAACVLLASSCQDPEELDPQLQLQNKPQRPGDTAVVVSPGDSVLPPWIEKWIWVEYSRNDGCWPITETYPPPEDLFGADARAITIDWRDSTYTSQSCKSADNYQIVPEISGKFSWKDTTVMSLGDPYSATQIIFSNGITMGPLEIKVWIKAPDTWVYGWENAYAETYQVPNQIVYLHTKEYEGTHEFQLFFLRITSQKYIHQPKKQPKNNKIINI